jgi:hypothetical protein
MTPALFAVAIIALMPLTGCDNAEAKKNLAECMLHPHSRDVTGSFNASYLELCMQAKSFVFDRNLSWRGTVCGDESYMRIDANCYRGDSWFAELRARTGI